MTGTRLRTAEERHRDILAEAAAIGIDEDYVAHLVDTFYAKVRQHEVLGPIFNGVIGDNWDHHLSKLKKFWASVALDAGSYDGRPVPAHVKLDGITPDHFQVWLGLFRETLEETAPTGAAVAFFMTRAERIAQSLQYAMFSIPGLKVGKS